MTKIEIAEDRIADHLAGAIREGLTETFGRDTRLSDAEVEAIVALTDGAIARRLAAGLSPA